MTTALHGGFHNLQTPSVPVASLDAGEGAHATWECLPRPWRGHKMDAPVPPDTTLRPAGRYQIAWTIRFATDNPDVPADTGFVSVVDPTLLRVGAGATEPTLVSDPDTHGQTLDPNMDTDPAGLVENGRPPTVARQYASVERTLTQSHVVQAAADGSLWLMVSAHSLHPPIETVIYQSIDVTLTPV